MNNVPVVSLQTAVLNQVLEFAKSNTVFSIHDITRTLRNEVNTGVLEIPECEVPNNDDFKYVINHSVVKDIFNELENRGVFENADVQLTRKFNGTYFEYTAVVTPIQVPAVVPDDEVDDVVDDVVAEVAESVETRVLTYLYNCEKAQVNPTLKSVQSAIKRRWDTKTATVAELLTLVKRLGYSVSQDGDYTSWTVVNVTY